MAGLANLFYLGQPDPEQMIARALSGQQQQLGQQPPQPGGPAPAGGPGQQAPAQPTPQAYQSPPDLQAANQQLANPNIMSLYVQMDQRDRAMQGINSAFAQIAANHSMPSMRAAIMQSANAGAGDAGSTMGNLMSLYQAQNQMAAQQQMMTQAGDIASKTGYPEAFVRAEIMAGRGSELMRGMQAPDSIRSMQWARKIYKDEHPNASPDEVEAAVPMAMFTGVGGGDATQQSWLHARSLVPPSEWPDHPEFADALTYGLYQQDQKKRQDNVDASAATFGQYHGGLMDVRGKVAAIQSNPELDGVLQNPALVAAVREQRAGTFKGDIAGWLAQNHYKPEQMQLVNDILDLSDPDYVKALQGKASASTQGDILPITTSLSALGRLGTAPKQYGGILTGALDAVDNADANAFGSSGQLDQIGDDDEKRKRVSSAYLPGGASFVGRGKPMPPDEVAAAKESMKEKPKAEVIDLYRRHGYNTKPIE